MRPKEIVSRTEILFIGLLILITPVMILGVTFAFLTLARGLVLGELSMLELIELYVLELALFTVSSYLLFRLLIYLVEERLPEAIDKKDELQADGSDDENDQTAPGEPPPSRDELDKWQLRSELILSILSNDTDHLIGVKSKKQQRDPIPVA